MARLRTAVLIVATCCLATWLLWPKPVCRVPSTVMVAGRSVTIESVERLADGCVMVKLLVHPLKGWKLSKIGKTAIENGGEVQGRWVKTDTDGTVHAELVFRPINEKAGTFSMVQRLPYHLAGKRVTWRFRNVNPTLLPVSITQSGTNVVLKSFHVNGAVDSNLTPGQGGYRWISRTFYSSARWKGKQFYSLEIELPMPDGCSQQWDCVLSDGSGRSFKNPDDYWDRFYDTVQQQRAMGGHFGPNTTERLVGYVAPDKGSQLYDKRFRKAINQHEREVLLFAFPAINPPPKRVNVDVTGDVPSPMSEVYVTVRFDRVPLPK
jgi:hypothetical protein